MDAARTRTHDDDRDLAVRAGRGERDAQRELFQCQRRGVHHALYRILGSNRELEDLLQDAFVAIFRALPAFRGESSLGRWCQVIAARTAYLSLRRRKPASIDLATVDEILASSDDVARHVLARETARRLYAALDRIEVKRRIAFTLHVIDGRSLEEVAELTDSTRLAVKTRAWRARRELFARAAKDELLRDYLQELDGGDA